MRYGQYREIVLRRAWQRTWASVVRRSPKDLIRDIVFGAVAIGCAFFLHGIFVRLGALKAGDSYVIEALVTAIITACVLVAIFAFWFAGEALFATPFVLWREEHKRALAVGPPVEATVVTFSKSNEALAGLRYDVWDRVDPVRLFQAASLWIEEEPPPEFAKISTTQKVMTDVLIAEVKRGRLTVEPRGKVSPVVEGIEEFIATNIENTEGLPTGSLQRWYPDGKAWVSRANLKLLPVAMNEQPKFLFAGRR